MVSGDGDPALGRGLEHVLRDALVAIVDGHGAVEGDPHPDRLPGQPAGHAVPIATDLDVGVPAARAPRGGGGGGSGGAPRAKRSATTSWTVPCTRGSASSRSHCSAIWLRWAQLAKAGERTKKVWFT